jgi:hypothetical protein
MAAPCKYRIEVSKGEFKDLTEQELKDYLKGGGLEKIISEGKGSIDLSQIKPKEDAIQERGTKKVLQREQEGAGEPRGERKRVEPSEQGKKPSAKGEAKVNEEAEEGIKINRATNDFRRVQEGEQPYQAGYLSVEDATARAEKRLLAGEDVLGIVEAAETNKKPLLDTVEQTMLAIRLGVLDTMPKTDEVILEARRIRDVIDKAREETARVLGFGRFMIVPKTELDFYVDKMEANRVNTLTEKQKAEAKSEFNKQQAQQKKIDAQKAKLEELENKDLAEQEFKKIKSETKLQKKDFAAEKKVLVSDIISKWKKASKTNVLTAVPVPYSSQLAAIAPDVAKLMKLFIEEGAIELKDVVNKIHDVLKDEIEGLQQKDIQDIIAGKFTKPRVTKSELDIKMQDLKTEASLIDKIMDAKNGVPRTEKEKVRKNQRITELEKELNRLRKESGYYDEAKLKAALERNKTESAKLQEKIDNKDFSEKEKPISLLQNRKLAEKNPKLYNEYRDSIEEKDKMQHEYQMALAKDKLDSMERNERYLAQTSQLGKEAFNTVKALKAGIDNSVVFVQNGVAVMNPMNIKATGKALKAQIEVVGSEANFRRRIIEVHENKPLWEMIEASELDYIDPRGYAKSMREESFGGRNLLERKIKIGGKEFSISQFTTAPFERIFTAFSNEFRLQLFVKGAEELMAEGKTIKNSLKDYKDLASYINNVSGRGKLKQELRGQTENVISSVIWAPKLMASSLNMIGLGDLANIRGNLGVNGQPRGYYGNMSPRMRKYAIKQTAAGFATGITLMALYAMAPDKEVDSDPTSVTFGQVKDIKTGTSINIFGRFTPIVRYLAMMTMRVRTAATGKPSRVRAGMETYKFFRGKMAPATGVGFDIGLGMDYSGKPYRLEAGKLAKDLFEPLFVSDLKKQLEVSGTAGVLNAIPSFFGIKVANEKMFDTRDLPTLLDDTMDSEYYDRYSVLNFNDDGRVVTKDEFKQFVKERDAKIEELITNLHKNGMPVEDVETGEVVVKPIEGKDAVSKDELYKEINRLKGIATKSVKKKLFGVKEAPDPYIKGEIDYQRDELGIGKQEDEEDQEENE